MKKRMRRLRKSPAIRNLVSETALRRGDLIYPLFIEEGAGGEISSMPGVYRLSLNQLDEEVGELVRCGITAVLLFGIPGHKDERGSQAYDDEGIVQRAIRCIKSLAPELYVIADICMCEYTDHGHCGLLDEEGCVDNDKTLELLSKTALSCARAGADMLAPSAMMDFQVAAIRKALDEGGFESAPIMAYSAKYASNFYGPFREAADSAPAFGDRRSYQMDYRNSGEALREIELDIDEGADIVMVKPALVCLDIVQRAAEKFDMPLAAYMVSGEYVMIKNAISSGLLSEEAMYEAHAAIKRAGADMIITYAARELCERFDI